MRSEWARQVCSTQKAHEIHNAAPAPKNRRPVASGSPRGSGREAGLSEKRDLRRATCRTSCLQIGGRMGRFQNGKRFPDLEKGRAFLRG